MVVVDLHFLRDTLAANWAAQAARHHEPGQLTPMIP